MKTTRTITKMLIIMALSMNVLFAQRALVLSTSDWVPKVPNCPSNCQDGMNKNGGCEGKGPNQQYKTQREQLAKEFLTANMQMNAVAPGPNIQQGHQEANTMKSMDTPEERARFNAMSNDEKMKYALELQKKVNQTTGYQPPKQESPSTTENVMKLTETNTKLSNDMLSMGKEMAAVEQQWDKNKPVLNTESCKGDCKCSKAREQQYNTKVQANNDKYIAQKQAIFNKYKQSIAGYCAAIDNSVTKLKYGDLCNDISNKRLCLAAQQNGIGAVDALAEVVGDCCAKGVDGYCQILNFKPCPKDNCFPATSKVLMADGSSKNINVVQENEMVMSFNIKNNMLEPTKVTKVNRHEHGSFDLMKVTCTAPVYVASINKELFLMDETTFEGTANHPVFVKGKGFLRIDELQQGDELIMAERNGEKNEIYVKSVESATSATNVYSLQTEEGVFIVDRIVVKAK